MILYICRKINTKIMEKEVILKLMSDEELVRAYRYYEKMFYISNGEVSDVIISGVIYLKNEILSKRRHKTKNKELIVIQDIFINSILKANGMGILNNM